MPVDLDTFPLRDRKRAQTRLALVDALIARLDDRRLEDVPVSELADAAGVSQATVFNYFPSKADILTHFIQLWSLQMGAVLQGHTGTAYDAVETLLLTTADACREHPGVMLETIAHQARMPADLKVEPVELVERALYLPDCDDVAALPDTGLSPLLAAQIHRAIAQGELPPTTDPLAVLLGVASVFFGVPLILGRRADVPLHDVFRRQLAIVWRGAALTAE